MRKIKTREEVSDIDRWNIELVYPDLESFDKDYQFVIEELDKLSIMKNSFVNDAKNFLAFFKQDEKVSRILEKLYIYAHCKNDEDIANSIYQALKGKMDNLYAEYNEKTVFVVPMILKMEPSLILKYVEEEKELSSYRHFFDVIFEKGDHILDEKTEQVLSAYAPIFCAPSTTASYLTNADLKFADICNEQGKKVPLNEASYHLYIKSMKRDVRKAAFQKIYEGYRGVENALTSTYQATVGYDAITARLRGYGSTIEMYLSPLHIPVKLYKNLMSTVHANLETLYEYYDLKKQILRLDEFHLYDSYVSIIEKSSKEYSFNEAKQLVIDALSVYGKDYTDILQKAFHDNWIDKFPNKGKKNGAYSTGSYDTVPYVLLNYTGTYNDVSTLAHELGHSMHTFYTNQNNPYITANYPIFLAEIASITNELLLSHYMYEKSTDKLEKLNILNEKLDLFKATLFRQTMFAEFEYIVHDYVDSKNILTTDYLSQIYYDLNEKYFGPRVVVDRDIQYEWLRVPHFYRPFYVYQYATSLAISCFVAENIIQNKPGFQEKYMKFLSSGGRDYPLEVLKIIDIDLNDDKVFESAMREFKNTITKFKKIYNEK